LIITTEAQVYLSDTVKKTNLAYEKTVNVAF